MGEPPQTTSSAVIYASYRQLLLKALGEEEYTDPPGSIPNGLVAAHTDAAVIQTGIHTGPVEATVQLSTSAPAAQPEQTWEEVAEVELPTTHGLIELFGPMADTPNGLPILTPQGPGVYGLRVHARGRHMEGGAGGSPTEEYLIIVWPIKLGLEAALSASSGHHGAPRTKTDEIREWAKIHANPMDQPGRLS